MSSKFRVACLNKELNLYHNNINHREVAIGRQLQRYHTDSNVKTKTKMRATMGVITRRLSNKFDSISMRKVWLNNSNVNRNTKALQTRIVKFLRLSTMLTL